MNTNSEPRVATGTLLSSLVHFAIAYYFELYESSTTYLHYSLLYMITGIAIFGFIYTSEIYPLEPYFAGFVIQAGMLNALLIFGGEQFNVTTIEAYMGLTRISAGLFIIWKITADMRYLDLRINPMPPGIIMKKPSVFKKIQQLVDGILYPPQEFFRLVKILIGATIAFHFLVTGLDFLSTLQLAKDNVFIRVANNLILLGIQAPLMMASRASISRTFTRYLESLETTKLYLKSIGSDTTTKAYKDVLSSARIQFKSINNNGKHLWLSVLLLIALQVYQYQFKVLETYLLKSLVKFMAYGFHYLP